MAKYLICVPGQVMVVRGGERQAVGRDSHAVIDRAEVAQLEYRAAQHEIQ